MRGGHCLYSSATALRRVFFQSIPQAAWQPERLFLPGFAPRLVLRYQPQRGLKFSRKTPSNPVRKFPRDQDIKFPFVHIRSPGGQLSEPQRTRTVLDSLNKERETLVLVAFPKAKEGDAGGGADEGFKWPICRVADLKEELRKEQEELDKQKSARKLATRTKEIELNWAIAPNDLQTRLRQLKAFLEKGLRVEILLLRKAGRDRKKRATEEEAGEVLRIVKETIAEVPGVKEFKKEQGKVGGQVRLFIDGPTPKKPTGEAGGKVTEME